VLMRVPIRQYGFEHGRAWARLHEHVGDLVLICICMYATFLQVALLYSHAVMCLHTHSHMTAFQAEAPLCALISSRMWTVKVHGLVSVRTRTREARPRAQMLRCVHMCTHVCRHVSKRTILLRHTSAYVCIIVRCLEPNFYVQQRAQSYTAVESRADSAPRNDGALCTDTCSHLW